MSKFTNKKLLAGIVMAGALLASGTASAALCSGTVNDWSSCTDADGDMTFTRTSFNIPGSTVLSVTEAEIGGIDFYGLGLNFGAGYNGGGNIHYTITSNIPGHNINGVNFDTDVIGATGATKDLFDSTGNFLLTLTSTTGSHDPVSGGDTPIGPISSLGVVDTFNAGDGVFLSANNSFTVPEPGSMLLLGVGLMGLLYGRRKLGA